VELVFNYPVTHQVPILHLVGSGLFWIPFCGRH